MCIYVLKKKKLFKKKNLWNSFEFFLLKSFIILFKKRHFFFFLIQIFWISAIFLTLKYVDFVYKCAKLIIHSISKVVLRNLHFNGAIEIEHSTVTFENCIMQNDQTTNSKNHKLKLYWYPSCWRYKTNSHKFWIF